MSILLLITWRIVIMIMLTAPPSVYIACLVLCTLCTLLTDLLFLTVKQLSRSEFPSSQCSIWWKSREICCYQKKVLQIYADSFGTVFHLTSLCWMIQTRCSKTVIHKVNIIFHCSVHHNGSVWLHPISQSPFHHVYIQVKRKELEQ